MRKSVHLVVHSHMYVLKVLRHSEFVRSLGW
jgi:hypothetical protein